MEARESQVEGGAQRRQAAASLSYQALRLPATYLGNKQRPPVQPHSRIKTAVNNWWQGWQIVLNQNGVWRARTLASSLRSLPKLQVPVLLSLGAHLAAVTRTMLPASRLWRSLFRRPWKPLVFPNDGFARISANVKIEEETTPDYVASRYYPVRIGEILHAKYQVVGKLGFGVTSTSRVMKRM